MNIVYADDDQLSLEIVLRALEARGHNVTAINSSKINELLLQLQRVLTQGPLPQVVILDGHNVTTDAGGKPVLDVQPTQLMGWLQRQGLPLDTPFILYSSDERLVSQAQQDQTMGFFAAVAKGGTQGGLNALLRVVESTGNPQSNPPS